jgi:20S proteasome alpha/beta subunit
MVDAELKETTGSISNNKIWMHGSDTQEEASMFEQNIEELMELEDILKIIRERIMEDTLNVY